MHDGQWLAERDRTAPADTVGLPHSGAPAARDPGAPGSNDRGLPCPRQSLDAPFRDPAAPPSRPCGASIARRRGAAVLATLALTLVLVAGTVRIAPPDLPPVAIAILCLLVAIAFLPIAQGAVLTILGLVARDTDRGGRAGLPTPPHGLQVAVLLPIHEEDPALVFGNAAAMLEDLASQPLRLAGANHGFALFILSDTRSPGRIAEEERALDLLGRMAPPGIPVHYRRRAAAIDRKMGNIRDWLETCGADWPAMLVLDADSLMSGAAIVQLADALAGDPSVGLVQSVPRILEAQTGFARLQAFSHSAHGGPLATGLAACAGDAGNYWGHNAILRTRAFAASAGLPDLPPTAFPGRSRTGTGDLILSHDFVEAALLRRAGWGVRILPEIAGSYEEAPPTLIDHALRDRRWCRGNMQHLRLLATPGLHPVSRVHLAMGAISYLAAPAWLGLVLFWVACRFVAPDAGLDATIEADPATTLVTVPAASAAGVTAAGVVGIALGALLLPRLVALVPAPSRCRHRAPDVLAAVVLSALYAPILMIQQTLAVARAALGVRQGWSVQNRQRADLSIRDLARFHRVETALGLILIAGILAGTVSPWLLAVALPLALAVPLSLQAAAPSEFLTVPEDRDPPPILLRARAHRRRFDRSDPASTLDAGLSIAAE